MKHTKRLAVTESQLIELSEARWLPANIKPFLSKGAPMVIAHPGLTYSGQTNQAASLRVSIGYHDPKTTFFYDESGMPLNATHYLYLPRGLNAPSL